MAEQHSQVLAYAKNQNLGLEVPYQLGGEQRRYIPDFVVLVDDGSGWDDPLRLIVEIKGRRLEDAKAKKEAIETYWIPGVNNAKQHGRWAFAEFRDVYAMGEAFHELMEEAFDDMILKTITPEVALLNIA